MDNNHEEEREDTLTNIRAVRAGVTSLFEARGQDQKRTGRLTKWAFGAALVILAIGMTAATHMSQGISEIRDDQQLVRGDLSKILLVTTNLAYEAEAHEALEAVTSPPEAPTPEPAFGLTAAPNTLGTQAGTAP
jgi:hypothetical protein